MMAVLNRTPPQKASSNYAGKLVLRHIPKPTIFQVWRRSPSSPKTKPNGDMLLNNSLSVIRTRVGTGPEIQAMPGVSPQRARAAARQIAADLHRDRRSGA